MEIKGGAFGAPERAWHAN